MLGIASWRFGVSLAYLSHPLIMHLIDTIFLLTSQRNETGNKVPYT